MYLYVYVYVLMYMYMYMYMYMAFLSAVLLSLCTGVCQWARCYVTAVRCFSNQNSFALGGVHIGLVHLLTSSVSCLPAGCIWHLGFDMDGYASIHCDGVSQCCTEIFAKSLHADSSGKLYIHSEGASSSWVEDSEAARATNKGLHI